MTRKPDEIKKGMEEELPVHYHIDGEPRLTPRQYMELQRLHKDALALIQQLQAENAEKDVRIQQLEKRVIHLEALNQSNLTTITMQERTRARLQERISQLEAERDAAVEALKNGDVCEACKHFGTLMDEEPCAWCGRLHSNFEWRGVQKEE